MNWFWNSPLPAVAAIVIIVPLVAAIYAHIVHAYHFICPRCGTDFKPSVFRLITVMHMMDSFNVKCPKCGHKEFMKALKDQQ